jgi:hypothetical protein
MVELHLDWKKVMVELHSSKKKVVVEVHSFKKSCIGKPLKILRIFRWRTLRRIYLIALYISSCHLDNADNII